MKWGYVGYHSLYHYINYCILYNEKANEKQKQKKLNCTMATLAVPIVAETMTQLQFEL